MLQKIYITICFIPALFAGIALYLEPGANPVKEMLHVSGEWSLNFLFLTLTVTPSRSFIPFNYNWVQLRRTLGLAAFFYAITHFTVFIIFEVELDLTQLVSEVINRNYLLVGLASLCILLPLAVTSTTGWQRRLKSKWLTLHKGIYIAAVFAIIHFFMLVKADYSKPIIYASLFALLMLFRVKKKHWAILLSKVTRGKYTKQQHLYIKREP